MKIKTTIIEELHIKKLEYVIKKLFLLIRTQNNLKISAILSLSHSLTLGLKK